MVVAHRSVIDAGSEGYSMITGAVSTSIGGADVVTASPSVVATVVEVEVLGPLGAVGSTLGDVAGTMPSFDPTSGEDQTEPADSDDSGGSCEQNQS